MFKNYEKNGKLIRDKRDLVARNDKMEKKVLKANLNI